MFTNQKTHISLITALFPYLCIVSTMSKVLSALIIGAYSALFIQYLRITLTSRNKDEIELNYVTRPQGALKKILRELKQNENNQTKLHMSFEKPERLPTDLKYILKWTQAFSHYTSSVFKNGQVAFIENKCAHINCFMTNDKSLLFDPRYFDVILFDVENNWDPPPILRAAHQKYVFTASESASNYPICQPFYDTYYNLTWTYKLNSDIRWSYITIEDKNGNFVGPKIYMKWIDPMQPTSETVIKRLVHKRKAAAWFVSNCKAKSGRESIGKELGKELAKYNLKLDTYGWCGEMTCPRDRIDECLELLEQDYYFYLAFENSLSEDYVTEKLLYPLLHMTVPIVYGGADYSRFLPPGSYINAREMNASAVAYLMHRAIQNPQEYRNYFKWHNHYVYKETPTNADLCALCEILNDPAREHSVVNNFRRWWNPDYEAVCKDELKLFQKLDKEIAENDTNYKEHKEHTY